MEIREPITISFSKSDSMLIIITEIKTKLCVKCKNFDLSHFKDNNFKCDKRYSINFNNNTFTCLDFQPKIKFGLFNDDGIIDEK